VDSGFGSLVDGFRIGNENGFRFGGLLGKGEYNGGNACAVSQHCRQIHVFCSEPCNHRLKLHLYGYAGPIVAALKRRKRHCSGAGFQLNMRMDGGYGSLAERFSVREKNRFGLGGLHGTGEHDGINAQCLCADRR
jgi:hypothetical protein